MKKRVFGINFDPSKQPGSDSRISNSSLDKFFGDGKIHFPQEKPDFHGVDHNPVEKYKTQCVPQTLPSVILRKKGLKP